MTDESVTQRDSVERLADTFMASYRAGKCPSVEEYAGQFPELADQLRELIAALLILEQNAPHRDAPGQSFHDWQRTAAPPREIGDFLIVREIARGGMGVVYEAIQQSLGRHVALKVLSSPGFLNPSHLERFRLEARAAARLHHTHIVPVFGVGEHNGLHYYAMQFIQGQSLDLVIQALRLMRHTKYGEKTVAGGDFTQIVAEGLLTGQFCAGDGVPLTLPSPPKSGERDQVPEFTPPKTIGGERIRLTADSSGSGIDQAGGEFTSSQSGHEFYRSVARVGLQVAEALAYAHSEGILHRDIKPSNLLLDAKGSVWITDFGLAKAEGCDGLTQTGDFVGTLRYLAPERLDGWSDRRGDVYGLGITLYELLTLRPFLEASSRGQLVDKIRHEHPPPLSKSDRSIPQDLETIVLKSLAKEPASRYHTAEALAEDLRRFLANRSILARRSTPAEQFIRWCRRNPGWAAMLATVAGLLLVIAVGSSLLSAWALRAERQARQQLFASKVNEARSLTLSRRPGQRFKTLSLVSEARDLAKELNLATDRWDELRNVAIAAHTLPDLYPVQEWEGFPPGSTAVDFDDNLEIYARTDELGNCSIRRIESDLEIVRLSGRGTAVRRYLPHLSRDGRFVVVHDEGATARLWRIERDTPQLVLTLPDVWSLDFHTNGREIAFAHTDGTITDYVVSSAQLLHRLEPNALTREIIIALHPKEPLVAVGSYFGNVVQVRDLRTGDVIQTIHMPGEGGHVAWHPTGRWLTATDGTTGRIHVFDRATFLCRSVLPCVDDGARVYFDHSGDRLAVVGWLSQQIRLYDFRTGKLHFKVSDANPTMFPRFSQDDRRLAGFVSGTKLGIRQVGAGIEYRALLRQPLPRDVYYGQFGATSPDGRLLAVPMTDGIGFWDLDNSAELAFLPLDGPSFVHFELPPSALAPSPSTSVDEAKSTLAPSPPSSGERAGVRANAVTDLETTESRLIPPLPPPHPNPLPHEAWGRRGRIPDSAAKNRSRRWERADATGALQCTALLIGERSGTYRWPIRRDETHAGLIRIGPPQPLTLPPGGFRQSRDGKVRIAGFRAVGHGQPWAGVWIQHAGPSDALLHLLPGGDLVGMAISPDGRWVVTSENEKRSVKVWDGKTGTLYRQLPGSARHPVFSPDGRWLALGDPFGRLVDAHTWEEVRTLPGLATFTADSRMMAVSSGTSLLHLMEVETGREICRLEDPNGVIFPMAFTPDGGQLITSDIVRGIRVWDLALLRRELAKRELDWDASPYGSVPRSNDLLSIQFDMGDIDKLRPRQMAANLDRAIEAAPQLAHRWHARGVFHREAGRYTQAVADLREAVKRARASNNSRHQAMLCNVLARALCTAPERFRDPAEALRMARRAMKLRPGEWSYLNTLGIANYRAGRLADSVAALEKGLASGAGQADAADLYFLAMCHHKLGDQRRAEECLKRGQTWHQRHASDSRKETDEELRQLRDEARQLVHPERASEVHLKKASSPSAKMTE